MAEEIQSDAQFKERLSNFSNLVETNIVHHRRTDFSIGISKGLKKLVEEIQEVSSECCDFQ
jgi:hypothetical protein